MATWLHFRESFCSINSIFILLPQFFCISGPLFSYCLSLAFRVEKAMAPHSSTLAWKIPWTEEPGRLQFTGSLGVGHDFTFTFHFHALEKEMATHFSVLAWRILGTGEPGGLPSMGSHRDGHNWRDLAAAASDIIWYLCFSVWLTSLSMIISRSIHAAADGIISLFLMTE